MKILRSTNISEDVISKVRETRPAVFERVRRILRELQQEAPMTRGDSLTTDELAAQEEGFSAEYVYFNQIE